MCSCGKEPETTLHYLLHCDFYSLYIRELLNDICALKPFLKEYFERKSFNSTTLWSRKFSFKIHSEILKCTIKFIEKTDRFSGPLFHSYFFPFD